MVTISLCMIVKNEERVLKRCLNSLVNLVDEIIIVDTGSTDRTKAIAKKYTDKIYDFPWTDDFSEARNFAFSKASMEYIYSADADELLSKENQYRFIQLKRALLPEIEIVQMKYENQLENGSMYNFDEEYRPKLFKRVRKFSWEGPVHEAVSLHPVVYDSDVVITHKAEKNHASRDFRCFYKYTKEGGVLSRRLYDIYVKELYMSGEVQDYSEAYPYFCDILKDMNKSEEELRDALIILVKSCRLLKDKENFLKYIAKLLVLENCSETCYELAQYYEQEKDYKEAALWYYNAVYETVPMLQKSIGEADGLRGLQRCYQFLDDIDEQEESLKLESV